jgi:hypothetical protein
MVTKPTVTNYQGAVAQEKINPRARFSVTSNAPQKISQTLYYELMVGYHTFTDKQMEKWTGRVWNELETYFGQYIDAQAASNPKRLHHVYEWGSVGMPQGRLWKLKRMKSTGGAFKISYGFVQSRRVAPIADVLKTPGPTGKVVKKTAVFKNKAFVMEMGIPVVNKPKTGRYLAFPANNARGIAFSNRPVRIAYPGGVATKFAFARSFSGFFRSGLAMKYLKPTLNKPVKVMKRAGERVPATITAPRFSKGISQSAIEQMARFRVEQESLGVY